MKILLIGQNGQLARRLQRELSTLGEVFIASRNRERQKNHFSIDLYEPQTLAATVAKLQPCWIVNAAAYTAVDEAEKQPQSALAANRDAPAALAQAAAETDALLVHYSTDYVFDGSSKAPWREDDQPNPQNTYGQSKLAGEQAIIDSGCAHLIFRTAWVYDLSGQNFVRTIARLARQQEQLKIVADQFGSPTWAAHLAQASCQILARLGSDRECWRQDGGLYHLTSEGQTSWHGFAEQIVAELAARETIAARQVTPINSAELRTAAKRPASSVLDCSRARARFGVYLPHWQNAFQQACLEADYLMQQDGFFV